MQYLQIFDIYNYNFDDFSSSATHKNAYFLPLVFLTVDRKSSKTKHVIQKVTSGDTKVDLLHYTKGDLQINMFCLRHFSIKCLI